MQNLCEAEASLKFFARLFFKKAAYSYMLYLTIYTEKGRPKNVLNFT